MFRLFFRFIGLLCLAGAFVALIVDGTRSVAAGGLALLPIDRTITVISPNAIETLHEFVTERVPALWDPVVLKLLAAPVWLVFGIVGFGLFALTRRRKPKIGYTRR